MRHEVEVPLATGLVRRDCSAPRDFARYGCGCAADDEVERAGRVDVLEEWVPDDLAETEPGHTEQDCPDVREADIREGHVDRDRARHLVDAPGLDLLRRIQ